MKTVDLETQRIQTLHDKFGPVPKCVVCSYAYVRGLRLHHVAGHKYGQHVVAICHKCLSELEGRQQLHPTPQCQPPSEAECSMLQMLGQAEILEMKAERIRSAAWALFEID